MVISAYRAMWLLAMFDLPVLSTPQKKEYLRFRKVLLRHGFIMLQYSVYARFCPNEDSAKVYRKIIRDNVPPEGNVRVVSITDIQFGKMEVYFGKQQEKPERPMRQLEFF